MSPSRSLVVTTLTAVVVLLTVSTASAIDKCKVKVDKKTGVIMVDAAGVGGPLLWGSASGQETNTFFNTGTCVAGDKAKRCQLANPATLAAKTAPAGCTLYLADGVAPCTAWISGCSPGARSAAGALVKDATGVLIGTAFSPTGQEVMRNEGGTILRLLLTLDGSGFYNYGALFYLSANCTGPVVSFPDGSMVKPVTVYGPTGYYPPVVTSVQTFQSSLQFNQTSYANQTDCDNNFGVGISTFVAPNACCYPFSGTTALGTAQTIDVSVFAPPFTVELQ